MTGAGETDAMSVKDTHPHATLALSTKVEEDFVAPLAALRGALEILRDFSSLDADERMRFIDTALRSCTRLQKGVDELARTVYAAGHQTLSDSHEGGVPATDPGRHAGHVHFIDDLDVVEIDFAGLEFRSSNAVNEFFDVVEKRVEATGRRWYFLVNYSGYSVWPEAWVAFAHRGKRLNVTCSLGTARYEDSADDRVEGSRDFDPSILGTREAALARIEQMKSAGAA